MVKIDITNKIFRIKCPKCDYEFILSEDELKLKGVLKCPKCSHEIYLTNENNPLQK
jgi:predicted Zn finger-like uncharacterized protein